MEPQDLTQAPAVAYEPPQVTDLGNFGEITHGNVFAGTSDDGTSASRFYA
ncbi:lasso RiPP family leader peptide-containing protein [Nocardiopsis sp. FR26]|nr:lasso RiPP family leader peptide-containing protein [Nocardiopsis sp. FR26]